MFKPKEELINMRAILRLAFLLAFAGAALAQEYPARPVTIIVPQAAGGANDILGRIVAQMLSLDLAQQFVVENRVGAGPEQLAAALRNDVVKWAKVVKAASVKID